MGIIDTLFDGSDSHLLTSPTIQVLYTCDKCGIVDRAVSVVEKEQDEDITDWMYKVHLAMSQDHDAVSPGCHIYKFASCKIPLQHGSGAVGKADRH